MGDLPKEVQRITYSESGHLPFIDPATRNVFLNDLLAFLDRVDGVTSNRELKFADPISTLKELNTPVVPKDCTSKKTRQAQAYCEAQNAKALATDAKSASLP